jgi:hypothetical protein
MAPLSCSSNPPPSVSTGILPSGCRLRCSALFRNLHFADAQLQPLNAVLNHVAENSEVTLGQSIGAHLCRNFTSCTMTGTSPSSCSVHEFRDAL